MSTNQIDMKFVAAAKAMEHKFRSVAAYVIYHPREPRIWGKVKLSWTQRATGPYCRSIVWMPDYRGDAMRHHGKGHNENEAMRGAKYMEGGTFWPILDNGQDWQRQLEAAGYIVVHAT